MLTYMYLYVSTYVHVILFKGIWRQWLANHRLCRFRSTHSIIHRIRIDICDVRHGSSSPTQPRLVLERPSIVPRRQGLVYIYYVKLDAHWWHKHSQSLLLQIMSYGGELRYSFSYVSEIRSQENEEFYVGNHDVIIQVQYTYIQRS